MNTIVGMVAVAFVAAIGLCEGRDDGNTDFTSEEVDAIVARHNYHRANTKPTAANMLKMVRIDIQ